MAIKYIRKITKSKWNNQIQDLDDTLKNIIPADTIVECLKTKGNTLSIWEVEDTEDAVLALAAVSQSISLIDVITFEKDFFDNSGIVIENKIVEENPVIDLQKKHYDIVNLNYDTLGEVAKHIANKVKDNESSIIRYTVGDIKKIIKKAVAADRVDISKLSPSIQASIK